MASKTAFLALLIVGLAVQHSNAMTIQATFNAAKALLTSLQGVAGIGEDLLTEFKNNCRSRGKFVTDYDAFDAEVVDLVNKYNQSFSVYGYYPQDPSKRNILKNAIETYLNAFNGANDTLIPAESELKAILPNVQ